MDTEYSFESAVTASGKRRREFESEEALTYLSDVRRVMLPILSLRHFSHVVSSPVTETAPELMSEHELLFVTEGEVSCIIGGETYTAGAGTCFYSAPGELRCRLESRIPASYMTIRFWDERSSFGSDTPEFDFPHMIPYADDPAVSASVRYLENVCDRATPDQRKQCLAALQLLLVQLDDYLLRCSDNDYVRSMKKYLLDHYREGVQLADLADHVGLHPVYCAKIFKQSEGITVGAFINQLRITRAASLLESVSATSDAAEDLGLSEFYFSRWFRQMTGVTPTEYRDTLRAGYVRD